jgi:3',5'-cyclic AMP phosphodiesterase CpdA
MFRLAHISDIHLGPLPAVRAAELAGKRITGYVNWHRNRGRRMTDGVLDAVLADIAAHAPDHIAVTGDLVNLPLDAEIEVATRWLARLGAPENITVVPGNHDAYVPGAFDKMSRAWAKWMSGDAAAGGRKRRQAFPFMRKRGGIALIGCSSAEATAPFMAHGYFRDWQAKALGTLLHNAGRDELFRIVMIHHPPVRGATELHKRLFGIGNFQKTVAAHGAELVLHGHTHEPTLHWIGGKVGRVPALGVTAASEGLHGHHPPASWNLIEIDGDPGAWRMTLTRRGLIAATGAIATLACGEIRS